MDNNRKFISRLSPVEREQIGLVISRIIAYDTVDFDVKKLRGYSNIFRVRIGRIRIVYLQDVDEVRIVRVGFRDEKIYKSINRDIVQ